MQALNCPGLNISPDYCNKQRDGIYTQQATNLLKIITGNKSLKDNPVRTRKQLEIRKLKN